MIKIAGRSVFTGKGTFLSIEHDRVVNADQGDVPENAPFMAPAFIDLQVNGYAGYDYSSEHLSEDHLAHLVRLLASSGTARHVPTIITSSQERIVKNLQTLSRALKNSPELCAAIPGFHVEGP